MRQLTLHDSLERHWDLRHADVQPLAGGMNSTTWLVTTTGVEAGRWVAKVVRPADRPSLLLGTQAATAVDAAGVSAGTAEPTLTGDLVVDLTDGYLALLRWVEGEPLVGEDETDQARMGRALAVAHRALSWLTVEDAPELLHGLDLAAPHLDVRPWVRPAVAAAVAQYRTFAARRRPTRSVLHGDPAPESFLWSAERGRCGLIDWSSSVQGPRLYDLASAVMYVGGPDRAQVLLESYAEHGDLTPAEVEQGLGVMLQLRWAVQADYFARRIDQDDLTGVTRPQDNARGLMDAFDHLHPQ